VVLRGKCLASTPTGHTVEMTGCQLVEYTDSTGERMTEGKTIAVSDVQFAREFEDDEKAAIRKYRNQILEVDGVVLSTAPTELLLKGSFDSAAGKGKRIFCRMAGASQAKASKLSVGQSVKVKGRCEQSAGNGPVPLSWCEVVDAGHDPALTVSAAALTQAYAKDADAADAQYKNKELFVEGDFVAVHEDKSGFAPHPLIVLAGADERGAMTLHVEGSFPNSDHQALAGLKVGQKVTLKGECRGRVGNAVVLAYVRVIRK
jgi:hypothetical protein